MRTSSLTLRALRPLLALAAFAPLAASAQVIFMDFGNQATATPGWNNVLDQYTDANPVALTDFETNTVSAFTYQVTAGFSGFSTNTIPATGDFPTTATGDFLHGNSTAATPKSSVIEFTGFDVTKTYTFTFFSARNATSGGTDITTLFTLLGDGTSTTSVNSYHNTSTVSISAVRPDADGNFQLTVSKGDTNNYNYYFINALKIEAVAIPEPSAAAALLGLGALGMCVLRRRR